MDISQKRKILKKIANIEHDIQELECVRLQLAKSEFASASMSSGGGSKSYTRMDIAKVSKTISELKSELKNTRKLLNGENQALGKPIYTVYVGW